MQGVVKIYDPVTGAGVVVRDDDRSEVFLQPGSLKGSIFDRSGRDSESSSRSSRMAAGLSPSRFESAPTATDRPSLPRRGRKALGIVERDHSGGGFSPSEFNWRGTLPFRSRQP